MQCMRTVYPFPRHEYRYPSAVKLPVEYHHYDQTTAASDGFLQTQQTSINNNPPPADPLEYTAAEKADP